jgi:hypothetical protein
MWAEYRWPTIYRARADSLEGDMTELDRESEIAWIILSLNAIFEQLGHPKDCPLSKTCHL